MKKTIVSIRTIFADQALRTGITIIFGGFLTAIGIYLFSWLAVPSNVKEHGKRIEKLEIQHVLFSGEIDSLCKTKLDKSTFNEFATQFQKRFDTMDSRMYQVWIQICKTTK